MKTPIQELMDEFLKKADSLPDTLDSNVAYLAFQECYDIAKSMLNKEMTVIIEAFHEGMRCQGWDPNRGIAEEYYNETFNTNQENLQDSTNGYTYYPQENKTVFNTEEK
jgi:hypothetical protein